MSDKTSRRSLLGAATTGLAAAAAPAAIAQGSAPAAKAQPDMRNPVSKHPKPPVPAQEQSWPAA